MNISDFLPKYPRINQTVEHPIMDTYEDEKFNNVILHKKEFYDERTTRQQKSPNKPVVQGTLFKHQKTIARFLSSHTPYDSLLLFHEMGTGKTCSSIGAIEQIKRENSTIDGAIIIASEGLLENFRYELINVCTAGEYIPKDEDFDEYGSSKQKIRSGKLISEFYEMFTYDRFINHIDRFNDAQIKKIYSNKIIVIDEIHNLSNINDQYFDEDYKEHQQRIEKRIKKKLKEYEEKGIDNIKVTASDVTSRYEKMYKFLHLITNKKLLLLSGTPIQDDNYEIALIMNLMLPKEDNLSVHEFDKTYLTEDGKNISKEGEIKLKKAFNGRVSYIKRKKNVETEFMGEIVGGLKHYKIHESIMIDTQLKGYIKAKKMESSIAQGFSKNTIQASLAVFPDGTWGSEGFDSTHDKWIYKPKPPPKVKDEKRKKMEFKLTEEFKDFLIAKDSDGNIIQDRSSKEYIEGTLANIRKYSTKYAFVIKTILESKDESCFVYSYYTEGGGLILFSKLLELFSFTKANGKEKSESPRYALLIGTESSSIQQQIIKNRFNEEDNVYGKIIKVILGSKVIAEGFSFFNLQKEFILEPHWNYARIDQVIARGIRSGSHTVLNKKFMEDGKGIPVLKIYKCAAVASGIDSIDLHMYLTAENKDIMINKILRLMIISSFDCALLYNRNIYRNQLLNNTRECQYMECDYNCENINMDDVRNGIKNNNLDYSTYQLYYINPKISIIRSEIEHIFRLNNKISAKQIQKYFNEKYPDKFTRNDLQIALGELFEYEESEINYAKFKEIYYTSPVQKILDKIENIFKNNFIIHLKVILKKIPEYNKFEILTTLRNIIDKNIPIRDKYGFISYLTENNNMYFLVKSLKSDRSISSSYYTKNINIQTDKTYNSITNSIILENLPNLIDILCSVATDDTKFEYLIKKMPIKQQEFLIEATLVAVELNKTDNVDFMNRVQGYFGTYITKVNEYWVSTLLQYSEDISRCFDTEQDFRNKPVTELWSNCTKQFEREIEKEKSKQIDDLRNNKYGYYGIYDSVSKTFWIADIKAEKEKELKSKNLSESKGKKHKSKGSIVRIGKNCSSFTIPKLLNILVFDIEEINIPEKYKNMKRSDLLSPKLYKNKNIKKWFTEIILPLLKDAKEIKNLKTYLKGLTTPELQRLAYFTSQTLINCPLKKNNTAKISEKTGMCCTLFNFFNDNNLIIAGNKSKKSKKSKK